MAGADMEMEMVIFEALSMVEKTSDSCSDTDTAEASLCSEVCVAMGMEVSTLSSPPSILESLLDMAVARFAPRYMEVEMGEGFLATVDSKELEMMMVMLKPVNSCKSTKGRRCKTDFLSLDVETEMVLQQHMDI